MLEEIFAAFFLEPFGLSILPLRHSREALQLTPKDDSEDGLA